MTTSQRRLYSSAQAERGRRIDAGGLRLQR
jgi:hypothetical protein